MDLVKERAGVIITDLIFRNHLSNAKLGRIMECSPNTIDRYRRKRALPKLIFIHKLRHLFGVSINWLLHAEGAPYHGDGFGPLEQPDDEPEDVRYLNEPSGFWEAASVAEPTTTMEYDGAPRHERIMEALLKLARILEMKNSYSLTVKCGVEVYYRAYKTERKKRMERKRNPLPDVQPNHGDREKQGDPP